MTGAPLEQVLSNVIRDFGFRATDDPALLRGLLNDKLGRGARSQRALVSAVVITSSLGLPAQLSARTISAEAAVQQLGASGVGRMEAAEAVRLWAVAVGASPTGRSEYEVGRAGRSNWTAWWVIGGIVAAALLLVVVGVAIAASQSAGRHASGSSDNSSTTVNTAVTSDTSGPSTSVSSITVPSTTVPSAPVLPTATLLDQQTLDELANSCAAGEYLDCDFLYYEAVGNQSTFGATCGGGSSGQPGSCGQTTSGATVVGLIDACHSAPGSAECDELYQITPAGSLLELYALCGTGNADACARYNEVTG